MILALAIAVIIAIFVSALAGPNYDDPTPPIGWFFVILMAEIVGMALGGLA